MTKTLDKWIDSVAKMTVVEEAIWGLTILLVALWSDSLQGAQIGTVLLALFCLRAFIGSGGRAITPLGVFALVTLFTAGYPAYVAWDDNRITSDALRGAVALTFFLTFVACALSWRAAAQLSRDKVVFPGALLYSGIGVVLFALGYALRSSESLPGIVIESIAVAGVFLTAIGAWWSRSKVWLWLSFPVVIAMTAVYILQIHSGQGRLRIAALGLGLLLMFSIRFRGMWIKLLTILAGPAALMVFSMLRKAHQERINKGNSANRTGLESLTDPFVTFANLLDLHEQGRFDFQGGKNLLTPLTPIAPESWDLPRAIGYELVKYWKPEKAIPKYDWYSVAANATGEWYWMGGVSAVVIGALAVGAFLALLNWAMTRGYAGLEKNWWAVALFIVAVTFASGLGDMVWGGLHIYWYRSIPRVILEIVVVAFVAIVLWAVAAARGTKSETVVTDEATDTDTDTEAEPAAAAEVATDADTDADDQVHSQADIPVAFESATEPESAAEPEPAPEPEPVTDTAKPVAPEPEPAVAVDKHDAPDYKKLQIAAAALAAVGAAGAIGWLVRNRSNAEVDARAQEFLREVFNEK